MQLALKSRTLVKADITWSLTQVVSILGSKASMQHPSSLLTCALSPPIPVLTLWTLGRDTWGCRISSRYSSRV